MKKWAKWTIGVSSAVAVTTAIAVPVGLYCSGYWDKQNFTQIKFDVNSGLVSNARSVTEANVYDARYNKDAQEKLQDFAKNLSIKDLQRDFDRVLTDFYEAYEDETKAYEMEIEDIKVVSKNDNGSFKIKVGYEIESNNDYYTISKNYDSKEEVRWQEMDWTPNFTVLTKADVASIKAQINGFGNHDNNNGIDLKDLKEIFLGDKDIDDADDIGIFDRIELLNKDYNGLASLVAYELSISDIYDQLKPQARTGGNEVTKNTHFRIPSISLNNGESSVALVPNEQPSVQIDFSKSHIQGITEQELSSLPAGTYTTKEDIDKYLSFVFGTANQPKDIRDVEISPKDADGFIKLAIHFNSSNTPTEIFYLYVSGTPATN